jgi:ketosteroid isomerase-like protein
MCDASSMATVSMLQEFSAAWNRHDLAALMSFMHPTECEFLTAGGADVCGTRHIGQEAVARAFAAVFTQFPDAQWLNDHHFVAGDHGVSQWTFCATAADGSRIEVDGVDVFNFKDGKICVKNAFRKDRPNLRPGALPCA